MEIYMKRHFILALFLLIVFRLFCSGGSTPPQPPVTKYLIDDRIRNNVAQDTDGTFVITTFGVENFHVQTANPPTVHYPEPRSGRLMHFKILNSELGTIQFQNFAQVKMDGELFYRNTNDVVKPNFYTPHSINNPDNDEDALISLYGEDVGKLRYASGTGCWASPVIYRDQIIVLNKSGCLMSISKDFTQGRAIVNWMTNLRHELSVGEHHQVAYEYMATPTIVEAENAIYVAGIKKVFKIDLYDGTILGSQSYITQGDDYFMTPITYDTESGTAKRYNVLSKRGNLYIFDSALLPVYTNSRYSTQTNCGIPPLVDADGRIYVAGTNNVQNQNHNIYSLSQRNRLFPSSGYILHDVDEHPTNNDVPIEPFNTTMLTDGSKNLYLFENSKIHHYYESYFEPTFPVFNQDPLTYDPLHVNSAITYLRSGKKFPGNHSVLFERRDLNKTLIMTTNNYNNPGFFTGDIESYYPRVSVPESWDLRGCTINIDYASFNQSYSSTTPTGVLLDGSQICPNNQTWGGITPYASLETYFNAIFGDENGCITTYPAAVPASPGDPLHFSPYINNEGGANSTILSTGYSKFMQNNTNIPTPLIAQNYTVYVVNVMEGIIPNQTDVPRVFLNSYCRSTINHNTTFHGIGVMSSFSDLLAHPNYTLGFKNTDNDPATDEIVNLDRINVNPIEPYVHINVAQHIVVPAGTTLNIGWSGIGEVLVHCIELMPYSTLNVTQGKIRVTDKIKLGEGSTINIYDNTVLTTFAAECVPWLLTNGTLLTPTEIPSRIKFNMPGAHTGKFRVTGNFSLNSLTNSPWNSSAVDFRSYAYPDISYIINTMVVQYDSYAIFSKDPAALPISPSAQVYEIQNHGNMFISGLINCYNLSSNGGIRITIYEDGKLNLAPGGSSRTCTSMDVQGKLSLQGAATLNVYDYAILKLFRRSTLELNGNYSTGNIPDYNRAKGSQVTLTNYSKMILSNSCNILGAKPDPNQNEHNHNIDELTYGDRIITDTSSKIFGQQDAQGNNTYNFINLTIGSLNNERWIHWEGLYSPALQYDENQLPIVSDYTFTNCHFADFNRWYFKNHSNVTYDYCDFDNCFYGIYFDRSNGSNIMQTLNVSNSSFNSNVYGAFVSDDCYFTQYPENFKAEINLCQFGIRGNEDSYNKFGISLYRCSEAKFTTCHFNSNGYGVFGIESRVLIGGAYVDNNINTPPSNMAGQECGFYHNFKAGVLLFKSNFDKSLIFDNSFEGTDSPYPDRGIGIWITDSQADIMNNNIAFLPGHGFLGELYSRTVTDAYHGFSGNAFRDNGGCELIGDASSLSNLSTNGTTALPNTINHRFNNNEPSEPGDPFENMQLWNYYMLANLSFSNTGLQANVRGNIFTPLPWSIPERFYPRFEAFVFNNRNDSPLTTMLVTGINHFYNGEFQDAISLMKDAIEIYPDSTLTALAVDYLYLIERCSEKDYETLRNYLDLNVSTDNMKVYLEKEQIKTKCYIQEENYPTAIQRLQLIIDNPVTAIDSVYALIDQAYCYMTLAKKGSKSLPNCTAMTPTYNSYTTLMYNLFKGDIEDGFVPDIPSNLVLNQNYPNPFNPETTIRFSIPDKGEVKLSIFNIKGQKVKTLLNSNMPAGKHSIVWDGKNDNGRLSASGIYFTRIEHAGKVKINKMIMLK